MIIKEEFYNIKCDCCGKTINDEWMPDEQSARGEMAEEDSASGSEARTIATTAMTMTTTSTLSPRTAGSSTGIRKRR